MANTHDYIIANDTGANVRQDLNTLLLQIKATNAGDSAPSATAEGMLWYETDDDVLHLYNGSAWVEVIKAVGSGTGQSLGTGDVVTHANLAAITGTVQGVGQGNTPTFAGLVIADGTHDLNIASHDGSNGLKLGGVTVTASAAELNLLDGVTDICTQAELDARVTAATSTPQGVGIGNSPTFAGGTFNGTVTIADGTNALNIISHDGSTGGLKLENILVTSTAAELNILDGCTASTTELNLMDGCSASTAELSLLNGCTATTNELNILDGVTATTTELNLLDGVTATTAELNALDGITSTVAELNLLDGVTSTTAELNILDGVTATAAEINLLDGVTSLGSNGNAPVGGIIALASNLTGAHSVPNSGSVDGSGWMLCDGSTIPGGQTLSGTLPDLTDGRFLQGNTSGNAGGTGGNTIPAHTHTGAAHTHGGPSHSHTVDNHTHSTTHDHSAGGSHGHSMNYADTNAGGNQRANGNAWSSADTYTLNANANSVNLGNQGFTSGGSSPGTNSASGTTGSTTPGAGGSFGSGSDVLPKYLRVVYIMRVV